MFQRHTFKTTVANVTRVHVAVNVPLAAQFRRMHRNMRQPIAFVTQRSMHTVYTFQARDLLNATGTLGAVVAQNDDLFTG